jgi:hydroxypyruvate reductase
VKTLILGDAIEGEAREVAREHVQLAFDYLEKGPIVLLSGGETTVTIKGSGKGGRNSEYALAAVMAGSSHKQIYGLACDTDGIDGSEDNAGAIFTPDTLMNAKKLGIDPSSHLEKNDSYSFFKSAGGLAVTGPTFTNVNDFRAILVL